PQATSSFSPFRGCSDTKDSVPKVKPLSMIIWKIFIERSVMNDHGTKEQKHFPHTGAPGGHLFLAFAD
ncbi:MAG: hypothetical protein ACI4UV_13280, partial [Victivallales bacterium]